MKQLFLSLIFVMAWVTGVLAQQASPGSPVTPTGSTGLAAQTCITASGTNVVALTVPSPGGSNSNYIDYLMMSEEQTGAVTPTAPVPFTSTGIAGTPSFTAAWANPATGIVTYAGGTGGLTFPIPIKGLTATAVVFTSPATETGNTFRMTACWHVAP